jgi:hypothetical protein
MSTSTSRSAGLFSRFRILEPTFSEQFYWAEVKSRVIPADLTTGYVVPEGPVVLRVVSGKRAGDFLWNDMGLKVVNDQLLSLLERERFTGYNTYHIRVLGSAVPRYHGLAILGRAGSVDRKRSRVRWFENPNGTRGGIKSMNGLYFDLTKWDGCDLFVVDELLALIATDRVVRALRKNRVSNYLATPLSSYRV